MVTFAQFMPGCVERSAFGEHVNACVNLLDNIELGISDFGDWMDIASQFPGLSVENQISVMLQAPDATFLLSPDDWVKNGYQVLEGTKIALFKSQTFTSGELTYAIDIEDVIPGPNVKPFRLEREIWADVPFRNDIIRAGLAFYFTKQVLGIERLTDISDDDLYRLAFNYAFSETNDKFQANCVAYIMLSSLGVDVSKHKQEITEMMPTKTDLFSLMEKIDRIASGANNIINTNREFLYHHVIHTKSDIMQAMNIDTSEVKVQFLLLENGYAAQKEQQLPVDSIDEALNRYPQLCETFSPGKKYVNTKAYAIAAKLIVPNDDLLNGMLINLMIGERVIPQEEMKRQYIFDDIFQMQDIQEAIHKCEERYGVAHKYIIQAEPNSSSLFTGWVAHSGDTRDVR